MNSHITAQQYASIYWHFFIVENLLKKDIFNEIIVAHEIPFHMIPKWHSIAQMAIESIDLYYVSFL